MNAAVETSLTEVIDEALAQAEDPSPHRIAEELFDSGAVNGDHVRELVIDGLAGRIMRRQHTYRSSHRPAGHSGRWDSVKAAAASGDLDLESWAVGLHGRSKWLLDCSLADLQEAAELHSSKAAGHRSRAQAYERLAALLKERSKLRVGNLPKKDVRRVLADA